MQVGEAQFVDVREEHEFEYARLKHFELYPLSQMGAWLPVLASRMDPNKETYVLCHHGVRSNQAANFLLRQGFTKLYNVSGGIAAYSQVVDASIPQY
jgi:rhodanese-related sulfurtransferase